MAETETLTDQLKARITYPSNIGEAEQWLSVLGGLAVGWYGMTRASHKSGGYRVGWLTLAGLLVARGVAGHCAVYKALGIDRRDSTDDNARSSGVRLEHSVTVQRPVEAVYAFWRQVENWPQVMPHIQSVTRSGHDRFHCSIKGATGTTLTWDAVITDDRPNKQISWQTLARSGGMNRGTVHFRPVGEGTEVRMSLHYDPSGGPVGVMTGKILGDDPAHRIVEQLNSFKELMDRSSTEPEGASV
jgi:uncharacterized membrane protein